MNINDFGRNSLVRVKGLKERIREAEKEIQMREIKFRGKRKDNGEWVYGGFTQTPEATFIIDYSVIVQKAKGGYPTVYDVVEVIPETVGQSLGFRVKNEMEIFEGDVVNIENYEGGFTKWLIDWRELSWQRIELPWDSENEPANAYEIGGDWKQYEIIGNIHQNPELMEQEVGL